MRGRPGAIASQAPQRPPARSRVTWDAAPWAPVGGIIGSAPVAAREAGEVGPYAIRCFVGGRAAARLGSQHGSAAGPEAQDEARYGNCQRAPAG